MVIFKVKFLKDNVVIIALYITADVLSFNSLIRQEIMADKIHSNSKFGSTFV